MKVHSPARLAVWLALAGFASLAADTPKRALPAPLPDHPGNVFLQGEAVTVRLPTGGAWRLLDYEDRVVSTVPAGDSAVLGRLEPGFYRLSKAGESNWVSLAVLARLREPTPAGSPIALDVAMAWFYPREKMAAAASLCSLAGVNMARDRLGWGEVEPQRRQFKDHTRYDDSARAQSEAGLRVLQVHHLSAPWANPQTKRFPPDLRDAYEFQKEVARRWRGQVEAFEPWNEADIPMFGGHTGAEMAALQKAAYWGIKAGNPRATACLNVFALHNRAQLADLQANEAWPYFDTYNLHHYEAFDKYPALYADHRAVSAGRPLWVSECALPVRWAGDEKLKEPSEADLKVQAERVIKTFACSLHEGAAETFYFLLPHYVEGQVQFGILRPDLTPRPAYVALAAAGRLLADARPLGRWDHALPGLRGYLFQARPDARRRDVLVLWATNAAPVTLPVQPLALYDHLGRSHAATSTVLVGSAPWIAVLPADSARRFDLAAPPAPAAWLPGSASPVVLQALWPEEKTDWKQSAYHVEPGKPARLPVFIYNFGNKPVRGKLLAAGASGWQASLATTDIQLGALDRKELALEIVPGAETLSQVTVRGEFGPAGRPALSVRFTTAPTGTK